MKRFARGLRSLSRARSVGGIRVGTDQRAPVKLFYSDHVEVQMPQGHRFPMHKYRMVREALQDRHTEHAERIAGRAIFVPASAAELRFCKLAHNADYVERFVSGKLGDAEVRSLQLPYGPQLVARELATVGGAIAATRAAVERGVAGVLAGGTHHAHRDGGSGFCAFNDIAISAHVALHELGVSRILSVDLDVHQGDGTAAIFARDERVFTFSMHAQNNYPFEKAVSDLDVGLHDGCDDGDYLTALCANLPNIFSQFKPELVFFQAGVDALNEDALGRLELTRSGLHYRNEVVYNLCIEHRSALVILLGGGYSRPINATVAAHADVYAQAIEYFCE